VAHLCPCTYDGLHGPLCDERHEPFCLNQCSGHGLCDAHGGGFCHCDPGFFGVDCSMTTRAADGHVSTAARASARAEADTSIAQGKQEAALLALSRHLDDGADARAVLDEAAASLSDLPDLGSARALVDEVKIAVEAARITMMSRRSAHEELRREGEARASEGRQLGAAAGAGPVARGGPLLRLERGLGAARELQSPSRSCVLLMTT
jgi:hypothetical protein